jgi:Fe-S-cluster containining protein
VSKPTRAEREAFAAIDALYAELPPIACQGRCGISCQGGILMTDLEARRLQLATHVKPRTTDARGRCVYLSPEERCTVHAIRPLICRVWGVVKMLSCMHGCVPAQWLDDRAFLRLAVAIERIGGGRVLRTTPAGLAHVPGESFTNTAGRIALAPRIDDEQLTRNADRTRNLRALHGGRIMLAKEEG